MQKDKSCKVCEDYPDEVVSQVNTMLFLSNPTYVSIRRFFEEDMKLKAPTKMMVNRHKDLMHHVPNQGMLTSEEHTAIRRINTKKETELYNQITTQLTFRTLPKLAIVTQNLDIMSEKQELYAVMKNELANEIESIRSRPIIVKNQLTGKDVTINPLTKNAKELLRMMGTQLDSIEKTANSMSNVKTDVNQDIVFAFMQILGKTKMDIKQVTTMIFDSEIQEAEEIQEIDIEGAN